MKKLINFIAAFLCLLPSASADDEFKVSNLKITADRFKMESKDDYDHFLFNGNVDMISDQITAKCDELEVFTDKTNNTSTSAPIQSEKINKILASGHVSAQHQDRTVQSDLATIYPKDGKIVFEGNPKVLDPKGTVEGHRITFSKDSKTAIVEGKQNGERPSITFATDPNNPKEQLALKSKQKTNKPTLGLKK